MLPGEIVLIVWPLVAVVLFAKLDIPRAIVVSVLAGYLLLPELYYFDFPMIPTLNKHSIPAIVALVIVLVSRKRNDLHVLPGWIPKAFLPRLLLATLVFSTFLTVMTNPDPVPFAAGFFPALRPYDAMAMILILLVALIPFLLARKFLAHPDQQKMLLRFFVMAGALYAFLALYEVRMSPQISNMVYGFFPHSFEQHIRNGGFRPVVLLSHGLWLAIFFAGTIVGAFSLARASEGSEYRKYFVVGIWLLMTLSLSNSLGALAIVVLLLPIAIFAGTRMQVMICAGIAIVVLSYPALRGAGLVPIDGVLAWAQGVNPERAASLAFRLASEDLLLSRAQERPLFGWGGFGRNLVFDEFGVARTVTDGYWIDVVGQGGWARYLAEFGLLSLPPIAAAVAYRRSQFGFETTGLMLILIANLIDLIPNATITPLTWLVVGALWGRIELGRVSQSEPTNLMRTRQRGAPVYTRFGGGPGRSAERDAALPADTYARRHPS